MPKIRKDVGPFKSGGKLTYFLKDIDIYMLFVLLYYYSNGKRLKDNGKIKIRLNELTK